jgi:hypothetical protein
VPTLAGEDVLGALRPAVLGVVLQVRLNMGGGIGTSRSLLPLPMTRSE